jgi:hypothetical protein
MFSLAAARDIRAVVDNRLMRLRLAAGLLCGFSLAAQNDIPREVLLLSRIKQHMKDRLLQVPNYTCLETVERLEQLSRAVKFKPRDTVRFEVAEVDGKELFARPGQRFEHSDPAAFATGGAMANGLFSLHSRALFVSDTARFTYAGQDEIDGRKLVRYDYQVGLTVSGFQIVVPGRQATVAYHGSFWSDPQSLDACHFRVVAESIPAALGVQDAGVDIDYQNVVIRGAEALLPKRADLTLTDFSGRQLRNITTFSNCRHYGSDSVLTFDVPDGREKPK